MTYYIRPLGLLLLYLILGHDLLMAVPVVAAPHITLDRASRPTQPSPVPQSANTGHSYSAPREHPSQCGVGQEALACSIPLPEPTDLSRCILSPAGAVEFTLLDARPLASRVEPHASPGVRRALMQVYRV